MKNKKRCPKCKEEKNKEEFYKHKDHKDGLSTYCKECTRKKQKERRIKNPLYNIEYCREWRKNLEKSNKIL